MVHTCGVQSDECVDELFVVESNDSVINGAREVNQQLDDQFRLAIGFGGEAAPDQQHPGSIPTRLICNLHA